MRGWAYALTWSEALKRADKAGKLTGEGVKAARRRLKDFDLGGLTGAGDVQLDGPPAHRRRRPSTRCKGGKLVKVAEYDMPRKQEWLGCRLRAGLAELRPPSPRTPMLALKNVEVVYDDVILVLKGLSLEVPKGKIVALLGSNGAGKARRSRPSPASSTPRRAR